MSHPAVSLSEAPPGRLPFGLSPAQASVALATVLGSFVRLWMASRSEVWLDEANTALIALSGLPEMMRRLSLDVSPPLYYLILKPWVALGALGPFALRIPSLVFGCATIPALAYAGARLDRPSTGVAAAWLLALHPLHAYYSEEVRMYALLALLGLGFYFALFGIVRRGGAMLPAILLGAAAAYTHYYGLVFVGAGLALALVTLRGRRWRIVGCGVGVAVLFIPWLPVFLGQLGGTEAIAWLAEYWDRYPRGAGLLRSLQAFLPAGATYEFVPLRALPLQWLVILFGVAPLLWWMGVGVVLRLRRSWKGRGRPEEGGDQELSGEEHGFSWTRPGGAPTGSAGAWSEPGEAPRGLAGAWSGPGGAPGGLARTWSGPALPLGVVLLALVVLVVKSYLGPPIYLAGRSDIVALPIFLLALAMAVGRVGRRWRWAYLSLWCALGVLEVAVSAEALRKAGNERLAAAVDAIGCETIIATGLSYAPLAYYERLEGGSAAEVLSFPLDVERHPGHIAPGSYTEELLTADAQALAAAYPPAPGVCIVGAGRALTGPLAESFLGKGVPGFEAGVFTTSLLAGTSFVLVGFGGSAGGLQPPAQR